jgi:hypothetical protein
MADKKLVDLTEATSLADGDLLLIEQSGTDKKTLFSTIKAFFAKVGAVTASGLTMTTGKLLGRTTAGTGAVEEFTVTAAGLALMDDATASDQRTTLGAAASGAVTGSGLTMATGKVLGRTTASAGAIEELDATATGRSLLSAASVAAAQQAIDVEVGVDVQAYDADTAKKDTANTYTAAQRGSITALTDSANIATDMALNNFFSVTLAGNRTLDNPSNIVAGQSGCIFITQDGTGSRTLAYGSYWDFAGGSAPTLSTAASSVDRLDYIVRTTTSIHAVLTKAWA